MVMLATMQEMIRSTIGDLLQQQTAVKPGATIDLTDDNIHEHCSLDEDYPSLKCSRIVSLCGTRSKTPAHSQAKGKAKAKAKPTTKAKK
jgi:hypothetical protein